MGPAVIVIFGLQVQSLVTVPQMIRLVFVVVDFLVMVAAKAADQVMHPEVGVEELVALAVTQAMAAMAGKVLNLHDLKILVRDLMDKVAEVVAREAPGVVTPKFMATVQLVAA